MSDSAIIHGWSRWSFSGKAGLRSRGSRVHCRDTSSACNPTGPPSDRWCDGPDRRQKGCSICMKRPSFRPMSVPITCTWTSGITSSSATLPARRSTVRNPRCCRAASRSAPVWTFRMVVRPFSGNFFSLGSVIYEISTTYQPYADRSDGQIERLYAAGQFPDIESLLLGSIIRKCWFCQYRSAGEVVTDIDQLERRLKGQVPVLESQRYPPMLPFLLDHCSLSHYPWS